MWLKGMNFLSRKVPTLFFLANHLEGASLWKFGQTREQQGCFWNRSHVRTQPMGGKHKTEKSLQGLCRRQQVMLAFSNELWYTIPPAQGHLPETSAFMFLSKQEKNESPQLLSNHNTQEHLTLAPDQPILLLLPRIRLQYSFNLPHSLMCTHSANCFSIRNMEVMLAKHFPYSRLSARASHVASHLVLTYSYSQNRY